MKIALSKVVSMAVEPRTLPPFVKRLLPWALTPAKYMFSDAFLEIVITSHFGYFSG